MYVFNVRNLMLVLRKKAHNYKWSEGKFSLGKQNQADQLQVTMMPELITDFTMSLKCNRGTDTFYGMLKLFTPEPVLAAK